MGHCRICNERIEGSRQYCKSKKCQKKKEEILELNTKKYYLKRKKSAVPHPCRNCGTPFLGRKAYCDQPACQEAQKHSRREYEKQNRKKNNMIKDARYSEIERATSLHFAGEDKPRYCLYCKKLITNGWWFFCSSYCREKAQGQCADGWEEYALGYSKSEDEETPPVIGPPAEEVG